MIDIPIDFGPDLPRPTNETMKLREPDAKNSIQGWPSRLSHEPPKLSMNL